jgi:ClpP class serine protease
MGFLGFPLLRYINMEDSEEVLRALETTEPETPLDIVLHTPGGLVLASLQIARAINDRPGKVRVIVPHHAMSGGTLIALAADEIIMSPFAVLGPVDPQLGNFPAPSLLKLKEIKPVKHIKDETLILADMAAKAIAQLEEAVYELTLNPYGEEKARELSKLLVQGKWTHDYAITADLAREIGLNVSTEMSHDILALMSLYKQPTKRRSPTVDYIPQLPAKDQK